MILDVSDTAFKNVMNDKELFLPIKWSGNDYLQTINSLLNHYFNSVKSEISAEKYNDINIQELLHDIRIVNNALVRTVENYFNGFPSKAYNSFKCAMRKLMNTPLKVYQKSVFEQFEMHNYHPNDNLKLYRAVKVNDNIPYNRKRVFHTPYNLRSKVSTSRYSISGYPSLYLSTSLELCCNEINMNPYQGFTIASRYNMERSIEFSNTNIEVIELALKPQDFIERHQQGDNYSSYRYFDEYLLANDEVRTAYLLWYPLIAACSYIRTNKSDPFAAEYIIPQLLMQWVREKMNIPRISCKNNEQVIGIRYFSCASVKASDMGFNYVFPVSGRSYSSDFPYCPVLMKSFRLTKPVYINEFNSIWSCEDFLLKDTDFDYINS